MTFSKDKLKRSSFEHAVQADKEYHAIYFTKYRLGDENSWIAEDRCESRRPTFFASPLNLQLVLQL